MHLRASFVVAAAALLSACGPHGAKPAPASPAKSKPARHVVQRASVVRPSRLLPDLEADAVQHGVAPDGTKRFLTNRMRVSESMDGAIRKAPGLLPAGRTKLRSFDLPSRLGGGFLFVGSTSSRTQLWRADDWLAPLEPLVRLASPYDGVIPGFDRIYLTSRRANTYTVAIDPKTGDFRSLGRLPQPSGQGPMIFADAWRAVAVTDFRGPLVTFDAGATWVPLGIRQPVQSLRIDDDRIVIQGKSAAYTLKANGQVARHEPEARDASKKPNHDRYGPLGRRPLRVAIERGVPIAPNRALVAHDGHLVEVDTEDGAVLRTERDAYSTRYTDCQGIPLGRGVGFVCGVRQGKTTVYAYEAPDKLRDVLSYPSPQVVESSGNGAIVVRSPCPGTLIVPEQTQYCVRGVDGAQREIRFQGDLGAERVVALADGRVAILIAPRPGAEARLVVLEGNKAVTRALSFDDLSRKQRSLVRRGLWMRGAIEIEPGVVGAWVEGGGPVLGLHIGLDGKVQAGTLQPTPGVILLSGRFGLVWRHGGEGLETTDGGLTWTKFDLPSGRPGRAKSTRGCSAVGCAVEGWLRVGWGEPAEEEGLEEAPKSKVTYPPSHSSTALRLECAPTGRATPPPAPLPKPKAKLEPPPRPHRHRRRPHRRPRHQNRGWLPFGPLPAPALGPDEVGAAGGRDYGNLQFRAYVWGPKAADWSRAGQWIVRFDDPYDATGMPLSTTPAVSPWADLTIAAIHVNAVRSAVADPGGRAAVLGWCPSPNQCNLFGLIEGQTPLSFEFDKRRYLPSITSAVHTPEGWFLLATRGRVSSIYAVDGSGHARRLGSYPRGQAHRQDRVQLVRRSSGPGIAIWSTATTAEGKTLWFAIPVDTSSGELLGVRPMGAADLGGEVPEPCTDGFGGWLIDTKLPVSPRFTLPEGGAFGGSQRVRLRVDGDRACIEAMSARAHRSAIGFGRHHAWVAGNSQRPIPLAVWDSATKRKYEMKCAAR